MLSMLGPYRYLAMALVAVAVLGGAYLKGRGDGRAVESAHWQQLEVEHQAHVLAQREQLQAALDARTAELAARQQEAADAVVQVRTEFLPAKTIVKREVVERPVFRDCRIGDGMRSTLDAALRGDPAAGTPGGGAADGMPRSAPAPPG